jgi:hypothetical protein
MIAALCWQLIYVARGLEWLRLQWNTTLMERGPWKRWFYRERQFRSSRFWLMTPAAVIAEAPCAWMHPASVWLTRTANRGLPPLSPSEGFLVRVYDSPALRRIHDR